MSGMEIEYLSFGNLTLKLELPSKLLSKEKYTDFFCEEQKADFVFRYSVSEKAIDLPEGLESTEKGSKVFVLDGKERAVYYKSADSNGFFAVRRFVDGQNRFTVTLSPQAKGKLWTRLVLNTLGIDEIAAQKNAVAFHSSFIEKSGKAVLFTGPCGIGKSTQARLWNEFCGARIINGDKALIYLEGENAFASGLPFSGSSNISENKSMELFSIVFLEQGTENKVRRLTKKEAFLRLMKSSYAPPFGTELLTRTLEKLAKSVPVCLLSCTPDERAARTLEAFFERL